MSLIMDSREASKHSGMVESLRDAGVSVTVEFLEHGDFVLAEDCAVERKTIYDFAGTLTKRYLFDQMFALKSAYHRAILLLEGYTPVLYKVSHIKPQVVWGTLYSLARNGISIVSTLNLKETVSFLIVACKQEASGGGTPAIHHGKELETLADQQLYFVTSLPRIGPVKAIKVMENWATPWMAIEHVDKWREVSGISLKMEKVLLDVMHVPFDVKSLTKCRPELLNEVAE